MQRSLLHDMAEHAAAEGGGGAPMRHGTLEGHVLPGCLFLVWGCWWAAAFVRSWALAAAHGGRPGSGAAFYAPPWFPAAWLLPASVGWPALVSALERAEPFVKAVLPFVGLADELLPWSPLFQGTVLLHAPIHGCVRARRARPARADTRAVARRPPLVLALPLTCPSYPFFVVCTSSAGCSTR